MAASDNALTNLKKLSVVVADTGEFELVEKYRPQDSTTNPSLILGAINKEAYRGLIQSAVAAAKAASSSGEVSTLELAADNLCVAFGLELLKRIPGRVSTEVDARLSFNTAATVARAKRIIGLYQSHGINTSERVLIKIASTWEGLQAAGILEAEGIHTNLTLIFAACQARVAAEVGARLISPFVGRITDYWKAKRGGQPYEVAAEDPGVIGVKKIYDEMTQYFARRTEVMGASFRNIEQIIELAGLPLLTISPDLLQKLEDLKDHEVPAVLNQPIPDQLPTRPLLTQAEFLFQLNDDECASFKLAEGIRKFVQDQVAMEVILQTYLQ